MLSLEEHKENKKKYGVVKSPARVNSSFCEKCSFFNAQPVLLPCNHLLCAKCLIDMWDYNEPPTTENNRIVIKCAVCAQPLQIKES
jgi:hypothetical protein